MSNGLRRQPSFEMLETINKCNVRQADTVNHKAVATSVFQPVERRIITTITVPAIANTNMAQNHPSGLGAFLYGKNIEGVSDIRAKIEKTVTAIGCLYLLFAFVIYQQEL